MQSLPLNLSCGISLLVVTHTQGYSHCPSCSSELFCLLLDSSRSSVWDVIFNPEQIFGPEVSQEEAEYLQVQPGFLKLPTGKEGEYLSPVPCTSFSPKKVSREHKN